MRSGLPLAGLGLEDGAPAMKLAIPDAEMTLGAWSRLPRHPRVLEVKRIEADGVWVAFSDLSPPVTKSERYRNYWLSELAEVFQLVLAAPKADRGWLVAPVVVRDEAFRLKVAFLAPGEPWNGVGERDLVRAWEIAAQTQLDLLGPADSRTLAGLVKRFGHRAVDAREEEGWRLYDRARGFEQLGKLDEALATYTEALAANDTLSRAQMGRERIRFIVRPELAPPPPSAPWPPTSIEGARDRLRGGFYADAIDLARKASDESPIEARWIEAAAAMKLGRQADAAASLAAIVALDPDDVDALYARGRALFSLRRYAEALADFDRVTALRPTRIEAMLLRREADRAMRGVRATVGEQPPPAPPPTGLLADAIAHVAAGRHADALAIYDAMLAERGADLEALEGRALALAALGRTDEATAAETRALDVALTRRVTG